MTAALLDPARNLAEEHQALQGLLAVLQREQEQLMATGIDSLPELTIEKNALVSRITALARKRYAALAAAAHGADENGMREWLERGPEQHRTAHRLWIDLRVQAEAARELNRTNGLLIGKHLARNQSALNVLQSTSSRGNFYGPDGQSTRQGSSHRLIAG